MRFLSNKVRMGLSRGEIFTQILLTYFLLFQLIEKNAVVDGIVLIPPSKNLALGRRIEASYTCGEIKGLPIKEMYCSIAGIDKITKNNLK